MLAHAFPFLLAVLDVAAAVVYVAKGDPARGVYWISAAILTLSTVYIK